MLKKGFTFIIILLLSIQSSFSNYNTILLQNSTSPDFEILFQNPSYVLEKEQNNKILYICDEEKSECKINLKLVQPGTTSSLSSNLSCEITTTFESEQFERCNPSSVIFPEGINSVNIKVTNKDDSENFSEYNFIIQNGEVDTDILESEKNKILQLLKPEVLENKDVGIPEVNIPIYSGEAIIKNIISGEVKIEEEILIKPLSSVFTPSQEQGGNTILVDNIEDSVLEIPEFEYIFQNPSYILETHTENIYNCDSSKGDECKVNLKLQTLEEKDISSKFECEISFSTEGFSSLKTCNPNTVIFPEGKNEVTFTVFEQDNESNFKQQIIVINNIKTEETIAKPLSSILTPSQEQGGNTILVDNIEDSVLEIPYFQYIFQNPSYILETNTENIYNCDSSKGDECKVNLKLQTLEKKDISSKFECKISFSTEGFSSLKTCNPNTVIFPEGKNEVTFTVFEQDNESNFKQQIIVINNIKTEETIAKPLSSILTPSQEQGGNTILVDNIEDSVLENPEFEYVFQNPSYILETHTENIYNCDSSKGDECKINLKLQTLEKKDISSKFECKISFSAKGFSPLASCNPNTIIFPEGNNEVTFAVFEKGNAENSKQKTIFINNVEQESYSTIEKPLSGIFASSNDQGTTTVVNQNKEYYLPNTKIQVQGKIINSKKVGIQRMTCYTYSECSINFTSGKFYKAEREGVEFRWDFGNGQKYNDYNPKSLKFAPGNYKVKLTTTDNYGNQKTEIYRVEVINLYTKAEIKKINKVVDSVIDFNITEQLSKQLKIHSPEQYSGFIKYQKSLESIFNSENISSKWNESTLNNSSTEESSTKDNTSEVSNIDKQLAKDIKLRVSFQKKNLKIYGETFPDSKINIAIGEEIFTSTSDNTGKYELKINSQLVEGKYKITATAFNEHGKIIALKHSSEKEITQDYIVQLQSYIKIAGEKSNTTTKKSTTNTKTELEKKLSKNISLRVSLQKKNLKLFGTTQANSKIIFTIGEQTFTTSSGNKGEYELKTNSIQVGSYKILANVYNNGKLVAQKSSSKKTFSAEYITNMRSYLQPKTSSSKSTTSKIKKFTLENFAPKIPSFVPNTGFNLKVFVINMLIAILSLILLFIVMIKRKLI